MKIDHSIRRATMFAAIVLSLALVAPESTFAGAYEDALAVVEGTYGTVGDTNTGQQGDVSWRVIELTMAAKELKASSDDAGALAKILEAQAIVAASQ